MICARFILTRLSRCTLNLTGQRRVIKMKSGVFNYNLGYDRIIWCFTDIHVPKVDADGYTLADGRWRTPPGLRIAFEELDAYSLEGEEDYDGYQNWTVKHRVFISYPNLKHTAKNLVEHLIENFATRPTDKKRLTTAFAFCLHGRFEKRVKQ